MQKFDVSFVVQLENRVLTAEAGNGEKKVLAYIWLIR
jgi:hypothetical protein